jgi:hypothetical protein
MDCFICFEKGCSDRNARSARLSPVVIQTLEDKFPCVLSLVKVLNGEIKEVAAPAITEVFMKLRRSSLFMVVQV